MIEYLLAVKTLLVETTLQKPSKNLCQDKKLFYVKCLNLSCFPGNKLTIHVFICLINSRQNKMNSLCGFKLRSQKLPHIFDLTLLTLFL